MPRYEILIEARWEGPHRGTVLPSGALRWHGSDGKVTETPAGQWRELPPGQTGPSRSELRS